MSKSCPTCGYEIDRVDQLITENARLRAERDDYRGVADDLKIFCDIRDKEIERLLAGLKGALSMVEAFASGAGMSAAGRAEFEGYRCALEGK